MKWTNYHSHTHYCDGKGEPELYVKSAIQKGMYAYGFSGHSPVPFESGWNMKFEKLTTYLNEIKALKIKYNDQLKIYLGMEIDYVKDLISVDQYKPRVHGHLRNRKIFDPKRSIGYLRTNPLRPD